MSTSINNKLLFLLQLLFSFRFETYRADTFIADAHQYQNKRITCSSESACFIYCKQPHSCQNSQILCPQNQHCVISCGSEPNACNGAIIQAGFSSFFELDDCSTGDHTTCQSMQIYFPPNLYGEKRAILNTGDNLKQNLSFYAIFGWADIDISGFTGTINNDINGTMHCSYGYEQECKFASNKWSCQQTDEFCNIGTLNSSVAAYSSSSDNEENDTGVSIQKSLQTTTTNPSITTNAINDNATVINQAASNMRSETGNTFEFLSSLDITWYIIIILIIIILGCKCLMIFCLYKRHCDNMKDLDLINCASQRQQDLKDIKTVIEQSQIANNNNNNNVKNKLSAHNSINNMDELSKSKLEAMLSGSGQSQTVSFPRSPFPRSPIPVPLRPEILNEAYEFDRNSGGSLTVTNSKPEGAHHYKSQNFSVFSSIYHNNNHKDLKKSKEKSIDTDHSLPPLDELIDQQSCARSSSASSSNTNHEETDIFDTIDMIINEFEQENRPNSKPNCEPNCDGYNNDDNGTNTLMEPVEIKYMQKYLTPPMTQNTPSPNSINTNVSITIDQELEEENDDIKTVSNDTTIPPEFSTPPSSSKNNIINDEESTNHLTRHRFINNKSQSFFSSSEPTELSEITSINDNDQSVDSSFQWDYINGNNNNKEHSQNTDKTSSKSVVKTKDLPPPPPTHKPKKIQFKATESGDSKNTKSSKSLSMMTNPSSNERKYRLTITPDDSCPPTSKSKSVSPLQLKPTLTDMTYITASTSNIANSSSLLPNAGSTSASSSSIETPVISSLNQNHNELLMVVHGGKPLSPTFSQSNDAHLRVDMISVISPSERRKGSNDSDNNSDGHVSNPSASSNGSSINSSFNSNINSNNTDNNNSRNSSETSFDSNIGECNSSGSSSLCQLNITGLMEIHADEIEEGDENWISDIVKENNKYTSD